MEDTFRPYKDLLTPMLSLNTHDFCAIAIFSEIVFPNLVKLTSTYRCFVCIDLKYKVANYDSSLLFAIRVF